MDKNYGYKHTKGFIVFFLFFIIMIITVAHGQTENNSVNVVQIHKWNNAVYMFNSKIVEVESSQAGPWPAYNVDTDTIRFSYGLYTVGQVAAINKVFQEQNIRITGYKYSWQIYNDLMNPSGTRGDLYGKINITDANKKIVESKFFDYSSLNTGAKFTLISGEETFKNPYDIKELDTIEVSWTGRDANRWSGFYGPRVRDVNVKLSYNKVFDPPIIPKLQSVDLSNVLEKDPVAESSQSVAIPDSKQQTKSSSPSLNSIISMIQTNNKKEQENIFSIITASNQAAESAILLTEQTAMSTVNVSIANSVKFGNQVSLNSQNQSVSNFGNTDRDNLTFTTNFLSNRANPLTEIVENNLRVSASNSEQRENRINKSAQNNELSGNVDIASIAIQPPGFNQYVNLVIRDVAFYAPKEIYRGQKTVDNVRALRTLASDGLHQEMVNQQYLPR